METFYPLARVLEVKKKRQDKAEKELAQKRELLRKEEEILEQKEAARDKAKGHFDSKLFQLRQALDTGTTSDKVEQMKLYLTVCAEKVEAEEQKVKEQQEQVDLAQNNVDVAREELRQRRLEVDKLKEHRDEWTKEYKAELRRVEDKDINEVGEMMYSLRKRRGY